MENDVEKINIEFDRTMQDVIEFQLFHLAHSPSMKKALLLRQLYYGFLVALTVFTAFFVFEMINIVTIVLSIVAGVFVFLVYPQLSRQSIINQLKKMMRESNNTAALGYQVISAAPEGIFVKNQATESKLAWSMIDKLVESDQYIYLYISAIDAIAIPQKCFQSEKEKQAFLALANKSIPKNKQ